MTISPPQPRRVVIVEDDLTFLQLQREAGWHVLDQHVLDPETRHIPVIVASGAVVSIELRRAALTPRDRIRVLLKPYTLDELLEVLSGVLRQRTDSWPPRVPETG